MFLFSSNITPRPTRDLKSPDEPTIVAWPRLDLFSLTLQSMFYVLFPRGLFLLWVGLGFHPDRLVKVFNCVSKRKYDIRSMSIGLGLLKMISGVFNIFWAYH